MKAVPPWLDETAGEELDARYVSLVLVSLSFRSFLVLCHPTWPDYK